MRRLGQVGIAAALLAAAPALASSFAVRNSLTRFTKVQADTFGLNAARAPDGFARAALSLSQYRKLEPTPIEERVFFDHRPEPTRIARAMHWKTEHLAEADVR